MKIVAKVEVRAQVTVTDQEAALIADMAGSTFATWYEGNYGKRFDRSGSEITAMLASIREQCSRIVKAADAAKGKIHDDLRD